MNVKEEIGYYLTVVQRVIESLEYKSKTIKLCPKIISNGLRADEFNYLRIKNKVEYLNKRYEYWLNLYNGYIDFCKKEYYYYNVRKEFEWVVNKYGEYL